MSSQTGPPPEVASDPDAWSADPAAAPDPEPADPGVAAAPESADAPEAAPAVDNREHPN